ncbi:MAG: hypothetical protein WCG47_28140 [Dermatophilaceae bacterium]
MGKPPWQALRSSVAAMLGGPSDTPRYAVRRAADRIPGIPSGDSAEWGNE